LIGLTKVKPLKEEKIDIDSIVADFYKAGGKTKEVTPIKSRPTFSKKYSKKESKPLSTNPKVPLSELSLKLISNFRKSLN